MRSIAIFFSFALTGLMADSAELNFAIASNYPL